MDNENDNIEFELTLYGAVIIGLITFFALMCC